MAAPVIIYPVAGTLIDVRRPWTVYTDYNASRTSMQAQIRDGGTVIFDTYLNQCRAVPAPAPYVVECFEFAVRIPSDIRGLTVGDSFDVYVQAHDGSLTGWSSAVSFTVKSSDLDNPIMTIEDWLKHQ